MKRLLAAALVSVALFEALHLEQHSHVRGHERGHHHKTTAHTAILDRKHGEFHGLAPLAWSEEDID